MAQSDMSDAARVGILGRAVRTQCRAFIEYLAESAPPFDIAEHPEVASELAAIVAEKRAMADRLVGLAVELGLRVDLTVAFEPRFTFYNYLATTYALKVLAQEGARQVAAVEAVAADAGDDPALEPILADMVALERDHLARVEALAASLRATTAAASA